MTPIRFGLSLPNRAVLFGMPAGDLIELAAAAEESGAIESIWLGDNLLSKPRLDAMVTLGALAARTTRVRLGLICMASFTLRHPLEVAIQWASLDVLSGGRTVLAVCIGGSSSMGKPFADELAAMGVESRERVARLEDGIHILRAVWEPGRASHDGPFCNFRDLDVQPKPVQARIPILIASNPPADAPPDREERILRRVALLGDGWQSDGTPADVFRRRWSAIRAMAADLGRGDEVLESCYHMMVNIGHDRAACAREAIEFLDHYYGATGGVSSAKLESWLACGPPSAVVDQIARYRDAGCTTLVIRLAARDQRRQLDQLLGEVLAAFA